MKNLFLFTISPVQSFIAQARKSQDLFAGSKLLSTLCRTAINKFKSLYPSGEIIFPANWENKEAALPNRFLAEMDIAPEDRLHLGQAVEEAVRIEFASIALEVFRKNAKGEQMPLEFTRQIDDHLKLHWLFEEMEGKSYVESYHNIEANLGAIKNARIFDQLPETEAGRKDSLSGELNALIFNKKFKKPSFTENAISLNLPGVLLSEGEGLSAVGFVKRFYRYRENEPFPSTAEIALMDVSSELKNLKEFSEYKNAYNSEFDFQLLYEENLNSKYFEKQGIIGFKGNDEGKETFIKPYKEKYSKLKSRIKEKDLHLNKYYAILIFDGDDMGKWLSGEYLGVHQENDALLKKYHKKFSGLLGEFATKAKDYVDDHKLGRTIFAGGDDFLALLNLENIFETLSELRLLFDKSVNATLKKEFANELNNSENLSFSAGLCIAHYKAPLSAALSRARSMEQKAKQLNGKNALALAVMKHSGEVHETAFSWGEINAGIKNMNIIQSILDALKNKNISPAFIQNLKATYMQLGTVEELKEKGNLEKIFSLELHRFLQKSVLDRKNKTVVQELGKDIENLQIKIGIKPTLDLLHIIDFIYRKA